VKSDVTVPPLEDKSFKVGDKAYTASSPYWFTYSKPEIVEYDVLAVSPSGRIKVNDKYSRGYTQWLFFHTREEAMQHYRDLVDRQIADAEYKIEELRKFREQCDG
jgi:hypothetical protein